MKKRERGASCKHSFIKSGTREGKELLCEQHGWGRDDASREGEDRPFRADNERGRLRGTNKGFLHAG